MYEENNLVFNPNPKITLFHRTIQNTHKCFYFNNKTLLMIQMLIVILGCNIVEFKVLKLIVNCLPLISFESRIKKKIYKFSSSGGILHISAKLQKNICKTSC